jgi:arylsulfatase A-like enzyme
MDVHATKEPLLSHLARPLSADGTVETLHEGRWLVGVGGFRQRLVEILWAAVWLGVLTGLAEVAILAVRRQVSGELLFLGGDSPWMAPLAGGVGLAAVGAALAVMETWLPRLAGRRLTASVLVFLAASSVLLLFPQLDQRAALVLAAGLAWHGGRWLAALSLKSPPRAAPAAGAAASTPPLASRRQFVIGASAAAVGGLALGSRAWQALAEQQTLAALPLPASHQPNVLLVVLDTVRARNLGLHGYARPTSPWLDQFARTAVRFEQALAPAPWTLPTHASIMTGRPPHQLSAGWTAPLDRAFPTLAEVLSAHGYLTAGFVANTEYCSQETGLNRGFAHYEDYPVTHEQVLNSLSLGRWLSDSYALRTVTGYEQVLARKLAPDVNRAFLSWLDGRDRRRPFFVFLNYYDAHDPYLPPEPFAGMFGPSAPRSRSPFTPPQDWTPDEMHLEMNAYDASLAYLDHHLGALFDELRRRDALDDTLVILTSDHGEEFGEHGYLGHGQGLYLSSLHVPLLLAFPGRAPAGAAVRDPIGIADIPATVMGLLGLAQGAPFPGATLARYWATPDSAVDPTPLVSEVDYHPRLPKTSPLARGDMRALLLGRYHYIRNGDASEELYEVQADSLEQHNLAETPTAANVLAQARAALVAALGSTGSARSA